MADSFTSFYRGKKVLVTGHTGFKGGWLTAWLKILGAHLIGFALPPETRPNLFDAATTDRNMISLFGDIRNFNEISDVFFERAPEIVIHNAAQPLVRRSYREPVETYATNVMGTVHVLEAARQTPSVKAIVIVTSDKCYENREWFWGYREEDALCGHGFAEPWNFGPRDADAVSVAEFSQRMISLWGKGQLKIQPDAATPHEAQSLRLNCDKARRHLGWQPVVTLDQALEWTVEWYRL